MQQGRFASTATGPALPHLNASQERLHGKHAWYLCLQNLTGLQASEYVAQHHFQYQPGYHPVKVVRSRPDANFTQITNAVLRDHRLSHMARGVLAEMLSYPDGWETTADRMWKQARRARPDGGHGEGQRAYRAAFRELEQAGYLERHRIRCAGGRFETCLILHDEPTEVAVPQHRQRPAETGRLPSSHRGTAYGTSVTATSLQTLSDEHCQNTGSTEVERGGLPAGSRGKPREREQPSEKRMIAVTRQAIAQVYGERENIITEDEEILDLYGYYVADRAPVNPVAYLAKIFGDAPDIGTLIQNSIGTEQAQDGLNAIRYGRCPSCGDPFTEYVHPLQDGRCGWCTQEKAG